MTRSHLLLPVAVALAASITAQADVIQPSRGKPIVARVWEQTSDTVTFNIYRTSIRRVTHGTQNLPAKSVKTVTDDPDPHRAFWRQAAALQPGTAAEWHRLGEAALSAKLKELARHAFVEALVREPSHAAAMQRLDAAGKKLLAADPRSSPPLREKLAAYLTAADATARAALLTELTALGCAWPQHYLDRARRSAFETKGRTNDRLLTLRSDVCRGVYTLVVPQSYDPLQPTPLLVALHGGGPGGQHGKVVVGSGRLAMDFYQRDAERLGWIVVCPTALATPWSEPPNEKLLEAVIEEVTMLFNVDRNRIYLTGHSMGGYGAWHYGPAMAHVWAAIAPMAGAGGGSLQRLRETMTGVYLYHGADDEVVGVSWDREIAERMLADDLDFVYAEIPDSGHTFPEDVRQEMWDFFAVRRLAITPGRRPRGKWKVTEETAGSFLDKPGKEELSWFGPLTGNFDSAAPAEVDELIAQLRRGGGLAQSAAKRLATCREDGVGAKVTAVLSNRKLSADSRRFAADALAGIADPETGGALQHALGDDDLTVIAAAARALGAVPHPETPKRYLACVDYLFKRFEASFIGGNADIHEFAAHAVAFQGVVEGATALADPACGAVIAKVAKIFLLASAELPPPGRAGDDPAQAGRDLARAVLEGCKACPGDAVQATLEGLAGRQDLGVAAEARELLK